MMHIVIKLIFVCIFLTALPGIVAMVRQDYYEVMKYSAILAGLFMTVAIIGLINGNFNILYLILSVSLLAQAIYIKVQFDNYQDETIRKYEEELAKKEKQEQQ